MFQRLLIAKRVYRESQSSDRRIASFLFLPFPKFRDSFGARATYELKLLQVSPLTSTRSYHESLHGNLSRRVLLCWPPRAVGIHTSDGVWNPRHGRDGHHLIHPAGRERWAFPNRNARELPISTELAFVHIPAAKWENVAPSVRVWGEKWMQDLGWMARLCLFYYSPICAS